MRIPKPALPRGRLARLAAAVTTLLVVAGVTVLVVQRATALPDDAAFQVGDTVVSESELNDRLDVLEALYGIRPPEDGKGADRFRRDSAKAVAVSHILDNAARERGIVIAERTAREILDKTIQRQMGAQGRAKFVELLGNLGASEQDVLDEIKRQEATTRLLREVTKDVPKVTDADVRKAFAHRRAELVAPEQRRLRNIVVAGKTEAMQVLRRARAGTSFAALVEQVSLDESTRSSHGDLGLVVRDQLEDGYADAAFKARRGEFYGPVKTRFGWNVGQVIDVRRSTPLPFGKVKAQLQDTLAQERVSRVWRKWLASEIEQADVEYADRYRPAHPDAPPAAPVPGAGSSSRPSR